MTLPAHVLANLSKLNAMLLVQEGYDEWAAKPHNKKWVKLLDGTPIPNDLVVGIAEVINRVREIE